jgi:hypothetical protein
MCRKVTRGKIVDAVKCWHERKTISTTSDGTGKIISQIVTCPDCGLKKLLTPCKECGHLVEEKK